MTVRAGHPTGPMDRFFLGAGPTTGFVLDFDGPPPRYEELAARVLRRAEELPVLRLVLPATGQKRWYPCAGGLRETAHLRRADPLRPGTGPEAVTDALLHRPLPGGAQPPWDLWLVGDPAGRRFRICYRVHHALQDGTGAAHTLLALLADRVTAGPRPHRPAAPTPGGALLAGRTLVRSLRPAHDWPVFHNPPSYRTRWTYQDVSEPRAREAAAAHSVTVNDVCLTALAQAVRLWHRTGPGSGRPCPDLPVLMPMSLRQEHELRAPGNLLTAHRLDLPCSVPHFEQAVRRVHRQTRAVRTTRARDASRLALRLLPIRLGEYAGGVVDAARTAPVITSSITLPAPFTCLGAELRAASMFSGLYGRRLCYISFTRAAGVIRCGMSYDSALPRAADIPRLWRAVFPSHPGGSANGPLAAGPRAV